MKKKYLLCYLVLALILLFNSFAAALEITLLHINDSHGRILADNSKASLGFTKIATLLRLARDENPYTLFLSAGDAFHGQAIVNDFSGEPVLRIFNELNLTAMAAGNHDFNYGYQNLLRLAGKAEFSLLSANVLKDGRPLLKPYKIVRVGPYRIAILGLTTPETAYKTHPHNVTDLEFASPVAVAREYLPELEFKADLVIALTHLGLDRSSKYTSELLAREAPGIDLIVDGHSHTFLPEGKMVNGTVIVSAGEYTKYLGRVDLTIFGGVIKESKVSYYPYDPQIDADREVAELISEYRKEIKQLYSEIAGRSVVHLEGERGYIRTGETNLGNLIADAMARAAGVKVALTNSGAVRASIAVGEITLGEIAQALPLGAYIVVKEMKGFMLKACLEHGVSSYPASDGRFLQVSGIRFKFDANKPAGERIYFVEVNGQPLEEDKTYQVAINDFMAAGGDGYQLLQQVPTVLDTGIDMKDSLAELIKASTEIRAGLEGRITRIPPISLVREVYQVRPGDTLSGIAARFSISLTRLAEFNQIIHTDLILPGQKIYVPR